MAKRHLTVIADINELARRAQLGLRRHAKLAAPNAHHLSTAVSAAGILGVVGASQPSVPDLVSDLGAYVGAFGGIGAATGWTAGIIARGLGRDVDVAKWTGYTTGAGAVMGVAAYITLRLGG